MWQNACPWDYGYGGWNWAWFGYQLSWIALLVGGGYVLYRLIKNSQQPAVRNGSYATYQAGACPQCKAPVEAAFLRCPECGYRLKKNCPECGKIIKTSWQICPYCEAELQVETELKS